MARILLIADAGSHGGFATVSHNIFERLVRDFGHDVHVLACNYKGDFWPTNLKLYVANQKDPKDYIGLSRIVEMAAKVMPDAVVFVQDPPVVLKALLSNPHDADRVLWRGMDGTVAGQYARWRPALLAYLAVDGYENPKAWDELLPRVNRIAMSHHGQAAMPEAPVVWHGVDTEMYHPGDKAEAKRALGFNPDRFLVLRVDKNTWRKDYPASWRAMRPVLRRHPDIDLHWHARRTASDGYDLQMVVWNDEDIRDRITWSGPQEAGESVGVPEELLATLFRAADLFVSTSWGEGFGLTILQAMASGTPVVAQDCSAVTEVVGPGGILIKPKDRMHVPMGQMQCVPDVDRFTYWIERLYESKPMREALGRAAVEQASKFSWDIAASRFHEHITNAIERNQAELDAMTDETPASAGVEVGVSI